MLLLSVVVHYQVLLLFGPYDTDTIATNKLYKLNFMYFTMYLVFYGFLVHASDLNSYRVNKILVTIERR